MKPNNIDLNKLNVFSAVMKHAGYRGASEELLLTKAAISQAISTLEAQIGKKLFLRVGNRMKATEEAEKFYLDLTTYQTHLQKAFDNLLGEAQSLSGELRIGAYFEFAKSKLMPVVEQFLRDHKEASLRFRFESPSKLDRLLLEQKIDLSISIYPHRGTKSIRSSRLLQQELILVAKKGSLPEAPDLQDFKEINVIDYFTDHVLMKRWHRHHFGSSAHFNVRVFAASAEMVLEMVRRGLGVGVVPRYVAEPLVHSGELIVVSPKKDRLFDHIWLNEWKEPSSSLLRQEFVRRLKTFFPSGI